MENRGAWSAAGGVLLTLGGGGAIAWLIAANTKGTGLTKWPVIPLAAVGLIGVYVIVAPLRHWWPWTVPALGIEARIGGRFGGDIDRQGTVVGATLGLTRVALVNLNPDQGVTLTLRVWVRLRPGATMGREVPVLIEEPAMPIDVPAGESRTVDLVCQWPLLTEREADTEGDPISLEVHEHHSGKRSRGPATPGTRWLSREHEV
jgi:hypothetical protein